VLDEDVGEFRTKRLVLAMYDAMADAQRTATAFASTLTPPPADHRAAHSAAMNGLGGRAIAPHCGHRGAQGMLEGSSGVPPRLWARRRRAAPNTTRQLEHLDLKRS